MMENFKKQWLPRMLVGGMAGLLLAAMYRDVLFKGGYSVPALCKPLIDWAGRPWAILIACVLLFGLGVVVGIATLPFADNGRELATQSLIHFAATATLWSLLLGVSIGARDPMAWLLWLGALALLYFLIWMVRWLGWYMELTAIRKKLGLTRQKKEGKTP